MPPKILGKCLICCQTVSHWGRWLKAASEPHKQWLFYFSSEATQRAAHAELEAKRYLISRNELERTLDVAQREAQANKRKVEVRNSSALFEWISLI